MEPLEQRTMLTGAVAFVNEITEVGLGMNRPLIELHMLNDTPYAIVQHRTEQAREPVFSVSLWSVEDGTRLFTDTDASISVFTDTDALIRGLQTIDDQLYFLVRPIRERNEPMELWKTDGTLEGTNRAFILPGHLEWFASAHAAGKLFFLQSAGHGSRPQEQLWVLDGADSVLLEEFSSTSGRRHPIDLGGDWSGALAFTVNTNSATELWTSDGTADGTSLVTTLPFRNGDFEAVVANRLFIRDRETDVLWSTDGTEPGTYPLSGIDSDPIVAGRRLFYLADSESTGRRLWVSDGTIEGTRFLREIVPGRQGCGIAAMVAMGGSLFFVAQDADGNDGLWRSDGTEEGTVLVQDQRLVPLFSAGGTLYLKGQNEATGWELWRSDGTPEGTGLAFDLVPGPEGSLGERESPLHATSNGMLYFTDWKPAASTVDVWRIPLPTRLPGDADGDGTVGFADFAALAANFGRSRDAVFADGDFDGNGQVDFADFQILSTNFGRG